MSQLKSREYDSVDLTEDEDSSEGNSEVDNPFNFIDCSGRITQLGPPAEIFENTAVSSSTGCSKPPSPVKNIPTLMVKPCVQTNENKKVEQFTSIQIKPPINSEPDTQNVPEENDVQQIETVSLDSDNESESANHLPSPPPLLCNPQLLKKTTKITLPKNDTVYSPKQPPGKVVIIKKNNKYYKIIIPHNVMPNINKSMGPVLINIPEVGPLVISNDPQAAKVKPNQFETQQLSLNLDAVDQNRDCEDATKNALKTKALVLRDKRFCWTFNSARKRDLDGFSSSDRLGFNKAETRKAKKCEKMITSFLTKCQLRLTKKVNEYEEFKKSLLKSDKFKLVKINSIIRAHNRTNQGINKKNTFKSDANLEPLDINKQESGIVESNFVNDSVESDDYGSDLLVTKKVVILNKKNQEIELKQPINEASLKKVRGRRKTVTGTSKIVKNSKPNKNRNFKIKPCYVQIIRDKRVEEAYMEYCKETSLNLRRKPNLKPKPNITLPKSIVLNDRTEKFERYFAASPLEAKQKKRFDIKNMLLHKIVLSKDSLKEEVNILKPILLITEHTIVTNRSLEYYCNEFSKNNIIYVVNFKKEFPDGILDAEGFISAVEIGYVKLVDANLFCKFVVNGMTFSSSEIGNHCGEHNYSFIKK